MSKENIKEVIIPNIKPKYEVGQTVFRILYGDLVEENTIRKVDYMRRENKVYVVYYFYRERTPFSEELVFGNRVDAELALMNLKMERFKSEMSLSMCYLKKAGLTEQDVMNRLQWDKIKLLNSNYDT